METVQWIVTAVLGLTFLGDIVLHFVLPSRKRKALDRFVRCFGLNPTGLHEALEKERT